MEFSPVAGDSHQVEELRPCPEAVGSQCEVLEKKVLL